MKKVIIFILVLVIIFGGGYLYFSKHQANQKTQLKKDVISYLAERGYAKDDYKGPEYLEDKSLKGEESRNAKVIFNDDSNYEYFYIKKNGKVQLFYAVNKKTSEEEFDKEEPRNN